MSVVSVLYPAHFEVSSFIFLEMDFFDVTEESETDSDLSDDDDHDFGSLQSQHEEDIMLRHGLMEHQLPSRNDWTFESYSKRGSEYIGNLKSRINSNLDSFCTAYNLFDAILIDKAKTEIAQILPIVQKIIFFVIKNRLCVPFHVLL